MVTRPEAPKAVSKNDYGAFASDMSSAKAEPINGVLGVVHGKNIANLPDAVLANVLIRMGVDATKDGMGAFYAPPAIPSVEAAKVLAQPGPTVQKAAMLHPEARAMQDLKPKSF